jgi:hypothetical protein
VHDQIESLQILSVPHEKHHLTPRITKTETYLLRYGSVPGTRCRPMVRLLILIRDAQRVILEVSGTSSHL